MTIYAWWRKGPAPALPAADVRLFEVVPGTQVSADCFWQPERSRRPAIIVLHGLEGSSSAHYMLGIAGKALAAGFSRVLLNQRNLGNNQHPSPGLYPPRPPHHPPLA